MTKEFSQAELLALSEQEKAIQKQMNDGAGREDAAKAAQFKSDTIAAMWARVISKLQPEVPK